MALTSKQRAYLRSLASAEDTIFQIGKEDVTRNVITSVSDALRARELVKIKVLESSMTSPQEACDLLAAECKAEPVQVIGSKFVLYKRNEKNPKIVLPKQKKTKA